MVSLFVGIYYPTAILPGWAERIASVLPVSYIFDGMRSVITTGSMDGHNLIISLTLNIIYIIPAYIFFIRSFRHLLSCGLIKAH